jgi:hypothetical protein
VNVPYRMAWLGEIADELAYKFDTTSRGLVLQLTFPSCWLREAASLR